MLIIIIFFRSEFEMGDECDKQLNLGIFVFDEENHERKSWMFFADLFYFFCAKFLT